MSPIILFGLLLFLTFSVLLYLLKPTSTEVAVQQHLADIEGGRAGSPEGATILKPQGFSSNPMLDDLLKHLPFSPMVSRLLKQAGRDWQVSSILFFSLLATLIGWWLASLMLPTIVLSACVGIGLGLSPFVCLYVLRGARFRRFDALLPEAVDLMARGLRAGHSIQAVLEMIGKEISDPVGSEFRALHEEQSLGLPMREAMTNLVERMPRDDMRFIATAILLHKESGGNLAQILDKTSVLVRERARLRGQLRIYTAQGRITGWILCSAPFLMFALISLVNPGYEKVLLTDSKGIHMIYGGLIMMAIGVLAIRKIIDIKV